MVSPGEGYRDSNDGSELALTGADSLPWLESDEYDPDEGAVDTSRIVGFAAILLVLLAAAIGGAWWYANYVSGEQILEDGSTILAPEGPYKVRPKDAGGKEFAGTGNVAPEVGEGIAREGQLAERSAPAPAPAGASTATSLRPPISSDTPEPASQELNGVGVQVGAYGSREAAQAGWATLQRQTDVLAGVNYRIVQGQADIGTVFRLQAVAADVPTARALCEALKQDGVACQLKR